MSEEDSYKHVSLYIIIYVFWQLKSSKPIESGTKKRSTKGLPSTDSAKEIDNLMRGDYSSRMKGRKRSPIHN